MFGKARLYIAGNARIDTFVLAFEQVKKPGHKKFYHLLCEFAVRIKNRQEVILTTLIASVPPLAILAKVVGPSAA